MPLRNTDMNFDLARRIIYSSKHISGKKNVYAFFLMYCCNNYCKGTFFLTFPLGRSDNVLSFRSCLPLIHSNWVFQQISGPTKTCMVHYIFHKLGWPAPRCIQRTIEQTDFVFMELSIQAFYSQPWLNTRIAWVINEIPFHSLSQTKNKVQNIVFLKMQGKGISLSIDLEF